MIIWKDFKIFVKGALMGAVNVVPVSSGTVSLILGVYERFINAIRSLNHKNFKYLFRGEFAEFGRRTDFRFFVTLVLGLLVGMVFTSIFLKSLLNNKTYEVYTWSFFIGLILASVFAVMRKIDKVNLKNVVVLLIGLAVSFVMSLRLNPVSNDSFLYMFLCGVIGATGMVVPGISGSHLMLLMGNYELIVTEAIPAMTKASTFMSGARIILPFLLGCLVSIVCFSYLLSWLMRKFRDETLSALSGFMLGSLPVVYPWKEPAADMTRYVFDFPAFDGEFVVAVLMAGFGVVAVYMLELLARRSQRLEEISKHQNRASRRRSQRTRLRP